MPNQQFPILDFVDQLAEDIKKGKNFKRKTNNQSLITLPVYDYTNLPQDAPNGQLALLLNAPVGSGGLYVNDQILASASNKIVFADIPQNLSYLELTWSACIDNPGSYGIGALLFNTDDTGLEHDYWWNLRIPSPLGVPTQQTADTFTDSIGGFAFFTGFDVRNFYESGSIKIPYYTRTTGDNLGYNGSGVFYFADSNPDDYLIGGSMQGVGPVTRLTLQVFDIANTTVDTPLDFYADSRFTLVGYPTS